MSVEIRAAATIVSQIRGARGIVSIAISENQAEAAIRALEKQIPKEIDTTIGDRLYGGCPVCGRLWQEEIHVHSYCDFCGQKLKLPGQDN